MSIDSRKHPSYRFAIKQLEKGDYLSVHQCALKYMLYEVKGWYDQEVTEKNIRQAVEDFRNGK